MKKLDEDGEALGGLVDKADENGEVLEGLFDDGREDGIVDVGGGDIGGDGDEELVLGQVGDVNKLEENGDALGGQDGKVEVTFSRSVRARLLKKRVSFDTHIHLVDVYSSQPSRSVSQSVQRGLTTDVPLVPVLADPVIAPVIVAPVPANPVGNVAHVMAHDPTVMEQLQAGQDDVRAFFGRM